MRVSRPQTRSCAGDGLTERRAQSTESTKGRVAPALRVANPVFVAEHRANGAPEHESRQALADGRAADERWHWRKGGSRCRFWGSDAMMAMRAHGVGEPIGLLKCFATRPYPRAAAKALETGRAELVQALVDNRRAPRPRPPTPPRTASSP